MLLTRQQAYILDLLSKTKCMKISQLRWFLRRAYSVTDEYIDRQLRQLRYLNQVWIDGEYIMLPERKRDDELITAVDIMLCFCSDGLPSFCEGTSPCKLVFFIPSENKKVNVFKLYFVPQGQEPIISMESQKQNKPPDHTVLFYLQKNQIPLLQTTQNAYFVLNNPDGGFLFYKS